MRVAIDGQVFGLQRHGGISRYFAELIRSLSASPELDVTVVQPWAWSFNAHANAVGLSRGIPWHRNSARLERLVNAPYRRRLRKVRLVHATYYLEAYMRDAPQAMRAVTVHDMIPELFPNDSIQGAHAAKERYVREADLVFCVSDSTRQDLLNVYGHIDAELRVTPLAVDSSAFRPGASAIMGWPLLYLLYVGKRDGYKDFRVLAEAVAPILRTTRGLHLMAVGGGAFNDDERELLRRLAIENRVHQRTLRDRELPGAYANAIAFALPSRYEGFGLTLLEAMQSGCPAVAARTASLPEVGGDAVVYFPPGDPAALGEALLSLVQDQRARNQWTTAGLQRSKLFTWAATAAATASGYRQISA